MTPEQCRAARGWLNWTQVELAEKGKVGLSTVMAFEHRIETRGPLSEQQSKLRWNEAESASLIMGERLGHVRKTVRKQTSGYLARTPQRRSTFAVLIVTNCACACSQTEPSCLAAIRSVTLRA